MLGLDFKQFNINHVNGTTSLVDRELKYMSHEILWFLHMIF